MAELKHQVNQPGLPENERVPCRLVGEDGDAYAIVGRVTKALRKHGRADKIEEYKQQATSGDYDHLLQVTLNYVYDTGEEREEEEW